MKRRQFLLVLATASCKKPFTCTDTTGLTAEEVQARTVLGYADFSTDVQKTCAHCQQFVVPADTCGTCKILKGPVHPNGTCKSFALKS